MSKRELFVNGIVAILVAFFLFVFSSAASAGTWEIANPSWSGDPSYARHYANVVFDGYLYAGAHNAAGGPLWRTPDGTTWTTVTVDGFGDPYNEAIWADSEFGGYLYGATWNPTNGGQVWRSADGTSWEIVATNGFDNPNNIMINPSKSFGGYLYASTDSSVTGQLWRSPDGTTWTTATVDGFGDPNNKQVGNLVTLNGYLYASTRNSVTGGQLWRSSDGTTWTTATVDGFSDPNNTKITGHEVLNGFLYVGTQNSVTGGQLWRSSDGTTWTTATVDGFSDPNNVEIKSFGKANGYIYAGTRNTVTGAEIWRSSDGTTWMDDGFPADSNYIDTHSRFTEFGDSIYVGSTNPTAGGAVWSSDILAPTTSLSTSPTVTNGDNDWFKTAPTITLTRDEPGTTYNQTDSTSSMGWAAGDTTGTLEGEHTLYYFSVDTAGNTETVKSQLIKVDTGDPTDPTLTSPSHTISTTSTTNAITIDLADATDTASGVEGYSITWSEDGTETPPQTMNTSGSVSSTTSAALADGTWWANVSTKDVAGNWTATAYMGPFVIDVGEVWAQVNTNGFGNPNNIMIDPPDTNDHMNGQLYAGTQNFAQGGEMWRSDDGENWTSVTVGGFTGPDQVEAAPSNLYFGYQYAWAHNSTDSPETWRSSDGLTWNPASSLGLPGGGGTWAGILFKEHVYMGSWGTSTGGRIWRSTDGTTWTPTISPGFGDPARQYAMPTDIWDGYLYAKTGGTSSTIYRSPDGTSWSEVLVDGDPAKDDSGAAAITGFKGDLYVGLWNGEIWRTADLSSWTTATAGFGDPNNEIANGGFRTINGQLYVSTGNLNGSQVWRSEDGLNWEEVTPSWDSNNGLARHMTTFKGKVFIGTRNPSDGGELWSLSFNNTSVGSNISPDVGGEATVTFSSVTSGGSTLIQTESWTAPATAPVGFSLFEEHQNISTDASYTGPITIALPYDETQVNGDEADIEVFHWKSGNWQNVSSSADTTNNKVTFQASSLSAFALGEALDTTPPITTLSTSPTPADGDNGWFKTQPIINLTRDEPGITYYQTDSTSSGNWTAGESTIGLDGEHTLYYFSVDTAGNTETIKSQLIKVDTIDPTDPSISSPSHTTGTPSADDTIDIVWADATDTVSGVGGYSIEWNQQAVSTPDTVIDVVAGSSSTSSPSLASGQWYVHLRTVDYAGNWTSTVHLGPFQITGITSRSDYSVTLLNGQLVGPDEVITDDSGRIYVSNAGVSGNFDSADFVSKLAIDGVPIAWELISGLEGASGLARDDSGNIYVAQDVDRPIQKYNSAGQLVLTFESAKPGLTDPNTLALTDDGRLLAPVANYPDEGIWRIISFDVETGQRLADFTPTFAFQGLMNLVYDNDTLYMAGHPGGAPASILVAQEGQAPTPHQFSGGLSDPTGFALAGDGSMFLTDSTQLFSVSSTGSVRLLAQGFQYGSDLAVESDGSILITDYRSGADGALYRVSPTGGGTTGNLVSNPGFETGDFTGWSNPWGTVPTTWTITSTDTHSGSYSALYEPGIVGDIDDGMPSLQQGGLLVAGGKWYTVSAWLKQVDTEADWTDIFTAAKFGTGLDLADGSFRWVPVVPEPLSSESGWVYRERTFFVPQDANEDVAFRFIGKALSLNSKMLVDDVELSETTSPLPTVANGAIETWVLDPGIRKPQEIVLGQNNDLWIGLGEGQGEGIINWDLNLESIVATYPAGAPYDAWHPYLASNGDIFYVSWDGDRVGVLDPVSGTLDETVTSPNSEPTGPVEDDAGNFWFAEHLTGKIAKWDRSAKTMTKFAVPTAGAEIGYMIKTGDGKFWFSQMNRGELSWFDPVSETFGPVYQVGDVDSWPSGFQEDGDGNIWYGLRRANKIAKFDTTAGTTTASYDVPTPLAGPQGLAVDRLGNVWFAESWKSAIGKLDPDTGQITEYRKKEAGEKMKFLKADKNGNIYFGTWYWGDPETDMLNKLKNTQIGSNVEVGLFDQDETGTKMLATFTDVSAPGETNASTQTPPGGAPSNYRLAGDTWNLTTGAAHSGNITVGLSYDEAALPGPEADVKLLHWNGSSWTDITTSLDTAENIVYGQTTNLSPFSVAVFGDNTPPSTPVLVGFALSNTEISLYWPASSDNIGVSGYKIYNGDTSGTVLVDKPGTSHVFTGLTAGSFYNYYMKAYDGAGNYSVASNSVRIQPGGGTSTPDDGAPATVTVQPEVNASVTFDDVVSSGDTTVAVTSTAEAPPPSGFELLGNQYDFQTSATYVGEILVSIRYDEANVVGPESAIRIFHWENGEWVDRTVSVDTANNIVTGRVSSFPPLVLGFPTPPPATGLNTNIMAALALIFTGLGGVLVWRRSNFPTA